MINVLFICLGNICRSPIAEGTFQQLLNERNLNHHIRCDSAGTSNYHIGELPDHRTRQNARKNGIELTHRARKLVGTDFADFEYIVAMDEANLEEIKKLHYKSVGFYPDGDTVFLLREFDSLKGDFSVPDPYYGNESSFEEVYQIVKRCNEQLIEYLLERHPIQ
jgi:protein-tyrosine phosphatase